MTKVHVLSFIIAVLLSGEASAQVAWRMDRSDGKFRFGYSGGPKATHYDLIAVECTEATKEILIHADTGPRRPSSGRGTFTLRNSAGASASISNAFDPLQPMDGHYWISVSLPGTHPIFDVLSNGRSLSILDSSGRKVDLNSSGLVQIMQSFTPACRASKPSRAEGQLSLPLQTGFYVETKMPCEKATNETVMQLAQNGRLSGRYRTRFKSITKSGPTQYIVTEELENIFASQSEGTLTATYDVASDASFTLTMPYHNSAWRRCAQSSMPDPWRRISPTVRID